MDHRVQQFMAMIKAKNLVKMSFIRLFRRFQNLLYLLLKKIQNINMLKYLKGLPNRRGQLFSGFHGWMIRVIYRSTGFQD